MLRFEGPSSRPVAASTLRDFVRLPPLMRARPMRPAMGMCPVMSVPTSPGAVMSMLVR